MEEFTLNTGPLPDLPVKSFDKKSSKYRIFDGTDFLRKSYSLRDLLLKYMAKISNTLNIRRYSYMGDKRNHNPLQNLHTEFQMSNASAGNVLKIN